MDAKSNAKSNALLVKKARGLEWAMYLFGIEAILVAAIAISVAFKVATPPV